MDLPRRHAIARAKLFVELADRCSASELNLHESYMEAAIVFCRTAIHRLKTRYEKHPGWKDWFDALRGNTSVDFIRKERDFILKEAPPKIGQIAYIGTQPDLAKKCYYYEITTIPEIDNEITTIPAIDTVRTHVNELERIIFNDPPKS